MNSCHARLLDACAIHGMPSGEQPFRTETDHEAYEDHIQWRLDTLTALEVFRMFHAAVYILEMIARFLDPPKLS